MLSTEIQSLARQCGFELAGVAPAVPAPGLPHYRRWVEAGMAAGMRYMVDHRARVRDDPRYILPSARSIICAGKLYNTAHPPAGAISRYAWGSDYHDVVRYGLERLLELLHARAGEFEARICVDTVPLLERSFAQQAGLGWLGKNTCLVNQQLGSWIFLGEVLTSLAIEPDTPPPDRCGTCTRCIDACPTGALAPHRLDARRCISYLTVEHHGPIPEAMQSGTGTHVFGCDICQDVCPWNRRAAVTGEPAFEPREGTGPDAGPGALAALSEEAFRERFLHSPVMRAKYSGFLRNAAMAMGNSGHAEFREPLERLAASPDPVVASAARRALQELGLRERCQELP